MTVEAILPDLSGNKENDEFRVLDYRPGVQAQEPVRFGPGCQLTHIEDALGESLFYASKTLSDDTVEIRPESANPEDPRVIHLIGDKINQANLITELFENVVWRETKHGDYPDLT